MRGDDAEFRRWYRSAKVYRRAWVPHGLDQLSILRSLYRYRFHAGGVLLDVGCGHKKFAEVFADRVTAYWGIDLPTAEFLRGRIVDLCGDATQLPIQSNSVDTVLSIQVLGMVYDPEMILREVHRVLKPGGVLILTYSQSGGQSDPTDYYRFTPAYYKHAFAQAGLAIEVLEARLGALGSIGEQLSTLLYYRKPSSGVLFRLKQMTCLLIQNVFSFLDRAFFEPHNGGGHVVVARKSDRELC